LASRQFGIALGVRARPDTMRNPFLLVAVAAAFVLQLAALYLPVLQQLLKTEPLTAAEVAVTCSLSAAGYVVTRLTRPSLAATSPVDQAPITRSA
jgi:Ca2+-transporting ATPase